MTTFASADDSHLCVKIKTWEDEVRSFSLLFAVFVIFLSNFFKRDHCKVSHFVRNRHLTHL